MRSTIIWSIIVTLKINISFNNKKGSQNYLDVL